MPALARLASSSCASPVLDVFTSTNGVLVNVFSASFQIWDKTSGTPVQVFPPVPGDKFPIDVDNDCPVGERLSTGRYVAPYTVDAAANIGMWEIRWFVKLTASSAEQMLVEEFEVLSEISLSGASPIEDYITVAEMRDEGLTEAQATDAFLKKRIALASRMIEKYTGRFFTPRIMTARFDGRGGPMLLLSDPIIAIEYVKFEISPLYPDEFHLIEVDIMRVYNRHLSQGLLQPDDRDNPKIELFNPGYIRERNHQLLTKLNFPRGQQNVEVKGVFGYTDPDGTNTQGKIPDLIKHATKLMLMRELGKVGKLGERDSITTAGRIISERTRDQSYTLEGLGAQKRVGAFTGDPEIDTILGMFQRPPAMGAV